MIHNVIPSYSLPSLDDQDAAITIELAATTGV